MKRDSYEGSGGICTFCCKQAGFAGKIIARINKTVPFSSTEVVPLELLYFYIYGIRLLARLCKYLGCHMDGTTNRKS